MSEKKVLIFTCVYIGLVLLLGGGAIYYMQVEMLNVETEKLTKLQATFRDHQKKYGELTRLRREASGLAAKRLKMYEQVPEKVNNTWDHHTKHLWLTDDKSGVHISKIKEGKAPRAPKRGGRPARGKAGGGGGGVAQAEEVYLDIDLKGGLRELGHFIHLLEYSEPLVVVQQFSMKGTKSGGRTQSEDIPPKEMKLTIKMFGFSPE